MSLRQRRQDEKIVKTVLNNLSLSDLYLVLQHKSLLCMKHV